MMIYHPNTGACEHHGQKNMQNEKKTEHTELGGVDGNSTVILKTVREGRINQYYLEGISNGDGTGSSKKSYALLEKSLRS